MWISYESLSRQYLQCRRHKRNMLNALKFEAHQEFELLKLQEELESRRYQRGSVVHQAVGLTPDVGRTGNRRTSGTQGDVAQKQ